MAGFSIGRIVSSFLIYLSLMISGSLRGDTGYLKNGSLHFVGCRIWKSGLRFLAAAAVFFQKYREVFIFRLIRQIFLTGFSDG